MSLPLQATQVAVTVTLGAPPVLLFLPLQATAVPLVIAGAGTPTPTPTPVPTPTPTPTSGSATDRRTLKLVFDNRRTVVGDE
jgi:hypothetical protein